MNDLKYTSTKEQGYEPIVDPAYGNIDLIY